MTDTPGDSTLAFALEMQRGHFRFSARAVLPLEGVTAIFGPSGSGKTTLLRSIAGLERACRGRLTVGGRTFLGEGQRLPPEERRLGYVFQESALFLDRSVRKNLEYAWKRVPSTERRGSVEEIAELVGIAGYFERLPGSLSGGERKRVAIARALLSCPRLLLMDEPLSALDVENRGRLLTALRSLQSETKVPMLYVTHSMMEVARLADRVLLMRDGGVTAVSSVEETLSRPELYDRGLPEVLSRLDVAFQRFDAQHKLVEFSLGPDVVRVPASTRTRNSDPGSRQTDKANESQELAARLRGWSPRFSGRPRRRSEIPGGGTNESPGSGEQRILVSASDVTLGLDPSFRTSVLNSLQVTVESVMVQGASALVHCRTQSGARLTASLTTHACEQLGITEGLHCFAHFKATSVRHE